MSSINPEEPKSTHAVDPSTSRRAQGPTNRRTQILQSVAQEALNSGELIPERLQQRSAIHATRRAIISPPREGTPDGRTSDDSFVTSSSITPSPTAAAGEASRSTLSPITSIFAIIAPHAMAHRSMPQQDTSTQFPSFSSTPTPDPFDESHPERDTSALFWRKDSGSKY